MSQSIAIKAQSDRWRREYIRLLVEPLESWTELTPERVGELECIDELIRAGYMSGSVLRDGRGDPISATVSGPTVEGRLFADEQQELVRRKSVTGQLRTAGLWLFGWLSGIASVLIIRYLSP